jgi:trehalose utilization protein
LGVGHAIAIGVGGGIEVREELALVEFSLPEVADAVLVGVVDGLEVRGGEEEENC